MLQLLCGHVTIAIPGIRKPQRLIMMSPSTISLAVTIEKLTSDMHFTSTICVDATTVYRRQNTSGCY